eukprot:g2240.t1
MSLYFFSVSLRNFVDEPTSTDIALSLTQGTAEALTLVCANALGCSVRHVYADAGCNAAALAAGASTRNKTLASGEEAVVQLCGSPLFGDGVLVTLPLGAATGLLSSPLSYRSGTVGGAGGQALALPHAPVSTAQLQRAATALEMGLTVAVAVDGAATQYWEAATPYSSSTQCSSSGGGVLVAPAVAATCYLLKARPTTTTATTTKTFSLLNMLEAWGAAYSFVFGLIGYFLYWLGGVAFGFKQLKVAAAGVAAPAHSDEVTVLGASSKL